MTEMIGRSTVGGAVAMGVMLVGSVIAMLRTVWRDEAPPVDSRLVGGEHVTFAFIAPTSARDETYKKLVREAVGAVREHAVRRGQRYYTIGISENWRIDHGLDVLEEFGPFDEVIVGRNWFNSGVERYITEVGAENAIPQVVVTSQTKNIDVLPWTYGKLREVVRIVGRDELVRWAARGFAVP